jgi:hypothetical protein
VFAVTWAVWLRWNFEMNFRVIFEEKCKAIYSLDFWRKRGEMGGEGDCGTEVVFDRVVCV